MGIVQFKREFVKEAVNGKPAELVVALVPMDGTRASVRIPRLSAVSRLSHLPRTAPSPLTQEASRGVDVLIEQALASIIVGDRAAAAGLHTPEGVVNDFSVCGNRTCLGHGSPPRGPPAVSKRVYSDSPAVVWCGQRRSLHGLPRLRLGTHLQPGTVSQAPDGVSTHWPQSGREATRRK